MIIVAYVGADGRSFYQQLPFCQGMCVKDILLKSDLFSDNKFNHDPDIQRFKAWLAATCTDDTLNHKAWYVGIYSQKVALDFVPEDEVRIEIYRPLTIDPMQKRQSKVDLKRKKLAHLQSNG